MCLQLNVKLRFLLIKVELYGIRVVKARVESYRLIKICRFTSWLGSFWTFFQLNGGFVCEISRLGDDFWAPVLSGGDVVDAEDSIRCY